MKLTPRQKSCLAAMERGAAYSPAALGKLLDTSAEGASATAASLVRRGELKRVHSGGHVFYVRGELATASLPFPA